MCVDRSVGEITESILPSMNMLSFAYDGSICLDVPVDIDALLYRFTGWLTLITIPSGFGSFDQIQVSSQALHQLWHK